MAKETCQDFLKFSRGFPEPHDNLLAKMVCQPNWFWLQNFHGFCQPNWFWLQNFHGFCQPKWFLATKFSRVLPGKMVFGYKIFTGFASQNGFWLRTLHGFAGSKRFWLQNFTGWPAKQKTKKAGNNSLISLGTKKFDWLQTLDRFQLRKFDKKPTH